MKKCIRSMARTMGLAALVSLSGTGCRFDLDSLRKEGGVQIADSGMNDSMVLTDGSYADGKTVQDAAVDALILPDAIGAPDAWSSCYPNDFNEDSDLEDLVVQNGTWVRDSAGYLKQAEATPIPQGYRMSYLNNATYSDLDATVKVRVPSGYTGDAHTGLLFRYTRNSPFGYDFAIDKGYILEIEKGTGTQFELVLEDAYISRLYVAQVNGGFDTWHTLRVTTVGNIITAYFNDEEIFTIQNSLYTSGHIGFGSHASVSHFDDLEVCPLQ